MGLLKKKKLIVVLGSYPYTDLFRKFGKVNTKVSTLFDSPEKVVMVVLSGGSDVHPSFYNGADRYNRCITNIKRDQLEQKVLECCKHWGIKITGICRGLQFLNVMNGGFMYQHITNHAINHMHEIYYPFSGEKVLVNSYHHQLIGLSSESVPIAWAEPKRSSIYVWPKGQVTRTIGQVECEAAIFPKIHAMGVQYHPEMMSKRSYGRIHFEGMFEDFLELSFTKFTEKYRRKADNVQRTDRKNR